MQNAAGNPLKNGAVARANDKPVVPDPVDGTKPDFEIPPDGPTFDTHQPPRKDKPRKKAANGIVPWAPLPVVMLNPENLTPPNLDAQVGALSASDDSLALAFIGGNVGGNGVSDTYPPVATPDLFGQTGINFDPTNFAPAVNPREHIVVSPEIFPVPEPGSILSMLAFGALLGRRRRNARLFRSP